MPGTLPDADGAVLFRRQCMGIKGSNMSGDTQHLRTSAADSEMGPDQKIPVPPPKAEPYALTLQVNGQLDILSFCRTKQGIKMDAVRF